MLQRSHVKAKILHDFNEALASVDNVSVQGLNVTEEDQELMEAFLALPMKERKEVVKMMKAERHLINKQSIKAAKKKGIVS